MLLITIIIIVVAFFAPHLWLRLSSNLFTPQSAPRSDAAIVFGAIVRDGGITPLHKERLDAAMTLFNRGKTTTIVVSNTPDAAATMRDYLTSQGVPIEAIEMDTQAVRTPDTCAEEMRKSRRRVAMVSQKFHLPRIALYCQRYGLDVHLVAADNPNRSQAPFFTRIRVRSRRLFREALFTWGTLFGVFPHQSAR